jgi:hypothetical protein
MMGYQGMEAGMAGVKDRVLLLFQTSLDVGELPAQWRNAKIIPLKKPNKGDYTVAKSTQS